MKLHLISSDGKKELSVAWVELNTPIGNFVIRAGHAPTLLSLSHHKAIKFCLKNGKQETIVIKKGIADIMRSSITILFSI